MGKLVEDATLIPHIVPELDDEGEGFQGRTKIAQVGSVLGCVGKAEGQLDEDGGELAAFDKCLGRQGEALG